jgi:hypothetical protein
VNWGVVSGPARPWPLVSGVVLCVPDEPWEGAEVAGVREVGVLACAATCEDHPARAVKAPVTLSAPTVAQAVARRTKRLPWLR